MVIRLHRNNFTGEIPKSLWKMSKLQILNVAYNNLRGTIPHFQRELNAMVKGSEKHYNGSGDVIQVMKGVDLVYTRTWDMVFNTDLSSNKLIGEIPVGLSALFMLSGLNLSNNHLSGNIPNNIGNMMRLESLGRDDPSKHGIFDFFEPSESVTQQLNLINDPSIYSGNRDICGTRLPKNCSDRQDPTTIAPKRKHKTVEESIKVWWLYLDIMCGFTTGFWGVIGVLLSKKHWRHKLFMFSEETMDKIYVAVMV
uniref:Leucine-rich repeat-containing N-terminal plant-type domain-containing protein n=1 Tax=Lactuca sativa TaxID=4236 RepID=A0A9R1UV32_LACSA|nr:hypothetical protein LSAT_V11C800444720 [Lactuca sativa]